MDKINQSYPNLIELKLILQQHLIYHQNTITPILLKYQTQLHEDII